MTPALILFARTPVSGQAKTRLCPPLSADEALSLYTAFLEDAARVYGRQKQWTPVLAAEPDPEHPALARLFTAPWRRGAQVPGNLGVKLTAAFEAERARGAPAVLAVGSDHPALPMASVEAALDSILAGLDAAIVPALDGGYCAIALGPRADLALTFRGVPWSTPRVLESTCAHLRGAGLAVTLLDPAYDVDGPEDLDRLRGDLARRNASSPDYPLATARALAAIHAEVLR